MSGQNHLQGKLRHCLILHFPPPHKRLLRYSMRTLSHMWSWTKDNICAWIWQGVWEPLWVHHHWEIQGWGLPLSPRAGHSAWYPDNSQELSVDLNSLALPYVARPPQLIQWRTKHHETSINCVSECLGFESWFFSYVISSSWSPAVVNVISMGTLPFLQRWHESVGKGS